MLWNQLIAHPQITPIEFFSRFNANFNDLAMKMPWYSIKWDDGSEEGSNSDSLCPSQVFKGTGNSWLQRLESWQFDPAKMLHIPNSILVLMVRSFFMISFANQCIWKAPESNDIDTLYWFWSGYRLRPDFSIKFRIYLHELKRYSLIFKIFDGMCNTLRW